MNTFVELFGGLLPVFSDPTNIESIRAAGSYLNLTTRVWFSRLFKH